ncbi:hypothetical protein [Shewanella xiamenensis]|uniref:hypothetical protein n=1 Tax=Shewanella xiamenensis TaxID=332186 RepID=UPI001112EC61|nr:hypothetical protein [Shewanella xiamenensis]
MDMILLEEFSFIEPLIRWGQYMWVDQAQYESDIGSLSLAYRSLKRQSDTNTCKSIFRGETSPETVLRSCSVKQNIKKSHECWTTNLPTAMRFALHKNGYVLQLIESDYREKILFDVAVLVRVLPESITNIYTDLQNTESEIVLQKEHSLRNMACIVNMNR